MDSTPYLASNEPTSNQRRPKLLSMGFGLGMFSGTLVGTFVVPWLRSDSPMPTGVVPNPPTEMLEMFVQHHDGGVVELASISGQFAPWAAHTGVQMLAGDFNGDGSSDVALIGGVGWASIPVAMSNGDGSYTVSNCATQNMATWAQSPGAKAVVSDFDGDGKDDIAVVGGGPGWTTIPVAFSVNLGCFRETNLVVDGSFPYWAHSEGVQAVAGDFNNDGHADIALNGATNWGTPGGHWATMPTAFGNGDGTFRVTNTNI